MMREQPMVDATLLCLVHVTDIDASGRGQGQHQGQSQDHQPPSDSLASTSSSSTAPDNAVTTAAAGATGPPFGTTRFKSRSDLMLNKMEELRTMFRDIAADPDKEMRGPPAAMERNISAIVSYPPPTWSMLQEDEKFKTCFSNMPHTTTTTTTTTTITSTPPTSSRTPRSKPPPPPAAQSAAVAAACKKQDKTPGQDAGSSPTHLSLVKHATSMDSFRPRPGLLGSGKVKSFSLTLGKGKEPSLVGRDETMKSLSEMRLEQDNRKKWETRKLI